MSFKRVTDLFAEGTELYLGDDDNGPVILWINKLNPYQEDEARRDGSAARYLRIAELSDPESQEYKGMHAEVGRWGHDKLAEKFVEQKINEIYVEALDDLETDPEAKEALETSRRLPVLLDDAGAPPDDPRRQQLFDAQVDWMGQLAEMQKKKMAQALEDAKAMDHEELTDLFFEGWRERETLDLFMEERRTTQIFYATRVCEAIPASDGTTEAPKWDHAACNHAKRAFDERKEVRESPDGFIAKVIDMLQDITVPARTAGNSDAPTSSSGSSEPSSATEALSQPSTPVETPPVAPTT